MTQPPAHEDPPPSARQSMDDPDADSPDAGRIGRPNGKAPGLVFAAVAAVIAFVAAGLFATYGDGGGAGPEGGGKTAAKAGKELFTVAAPNVPGGKPSGMWLRGAWLTDEVYARTTAFGVTGMDPATGERKWKLPLDGVVCNASERISRSGKTAVVVTGTKSLEGPCNQLVVFDVDSGKKEWQQKMPGRGGTFELNLTISREVVAVKWGLESLTYGVSGGPPLWKSDLHTDRGCLNERFTGGESLTAVVDCGEGGENDVRVQKLDPKTMKPTWEFRLPSDVGSTEVTGVVSTDPMVVSTGDDVLVAGQDGKLRSRISLDGRKHELGCSELVDSCDSALVDGEHLYLASHPDQGRASDRSELLAFDLDTGRIGWRSAAGAGREIVPVRMDGGKLIAYRTPTRDSGGEVLAIDPAGKGKRRETLLRIPDDSAEVDNHAASLGGRERVRYVNGRLYLQWSMITEEDEVNSVDHISAVYGTG